MFNVGVELGQITFVSVVAGLFALLARLQLPEWKFRGKILPYAIGSIAAFWTIERTLSFLVG